MVASQRQRDTWRNIAAFALLCISVSIPELAFASPWNRNNNELLIISRAEYFKADLNSTVSNTALGNRHFESITSIIYAEFGVTDRIMIGGKANYATSWLTEANTVEATAGFSELEAYGQYQVLRSQNYAGALKISASRPSDFQSGARPALESSGVDVELSALYGRNLSLFRFNSFATVETAYSKRFSDASDQLLLHALIGAEPYDRLLLLVDAYATYSIRNEKRDGADYDILKIQPSLVWRFSRRLRVQAGVTEEIAGRNIALGRTYFIGLWSSF